MIKNVFLLILLFLILWNYKEFGTEPHPNRASVALPLEGKGFNLAQYALFVAGYYCTTNDIFQLTMGHFDKISGINNMIKVQFIDNSNG